MEGIPKGKEAFKNLPPPREFKEGAGPIMVSIRKAVDQPGLTTEQKIELEKARNFIVKNFTNNKEAINVDWQGNPAYIREQNFKSLGEKTYVISPLDERKKFSLGLYPCTSLVVSGTDKVSGKNISFITHQPPWIMMDHGQNHFKENLDKLLMEVSSRCQAGTLDAVIVGGNFEEDNPNNPAKSRSIRDQYFFSVDFLNTEVKSMLGFEPVVVNGPSEQARRKDDIYFDTDERRLYLVRESVNHDVGSFTPSQIDHNKKLPPWSSQIQASKYLNSNSLEVCLYA